MYNFKPFILSVVKIAAALVLAGGVLLFGGMGLESYKNNQNKKRDLALETPINWPPISLPSSSKAQVKISTIWRYESGVMYQFSLDGNPRDLYTPHKNRQANFILVFNDSSGFKIAEYRLPVADIVTVVDDKGVASGVSSKGSFYLSADDYRKIKSWECLW